VRRGYAITRSQRFEAALYVAASAVSLAMVRAGFVLNNPQIGLITLDGPAGTIAPHTFLWAIRCKELTPNDWLSACDRLGIGHLPLVTA